MIHYNHLQFNTWHWKPKSCHYHMTTLSSLVAPQIVIMTNLSSLVAPQVVIMTTLSSLVAPQVVIMTTCGATSDDKVTKVNFWVRANSRNWTRNSMKRYHGLQHVQHYCLQQNVNSNDFSVINKFGLEWNGCHFAQAWHSQMHFILRGNVCDLIQTLPCLLKVVLRVQMLRNHKSTLVQTMVWHQTADKPLLNPMMTKIYWYHIYIYIYMISLGLNKLMPLHDDCILYRVIHIELIRLNLWWHRVSDTPCWLWKIVSEKSYHGNCSLQSDHWPQSC